MIGDAGTFERRPLTTDRWRPDALAVAIRPIRPSDAPRWLELRCFLWPESSRDEHEEDIGQFLAGKAREPAAVLLAEDGDGQAVGFAELSIRAYAEGCSTDRVAFLEGWFVVPEARRRGVGGALVAAAEEWGRSQGCTEFGSDAEEDNHASAAAHRALGFAEVGLIRCFRKDL
jgi:aminoglycoside 6'-N-acetyltransferase I